MVGGRRRGGGGGGGAATVSAFPTRLRSLRRDLTAEMENAAREGGRGDTAAAAAAAAGGGNSARGGYVRDWISARRESGGRGEREESGIEGPRRVSVKRQLLPELERENTDPQSPQTPESGAEAERVFALDPAHVRTWRAMSRARAPVRRSLLPELEAMRRDRGAAYVGRDEPMADVPRALYADARRPLKRNLMEDFEVHA